MKQSKFLKVSVPVFALTVFSTGSNTFKANIANAQSLSGVELYSSKNVVCVIAKLKIGIDVKSGFEFTGSGGFEFSLGRKDKCKPGLMEQCSATSCGKA
ncbi:hypothetical protein [uncultured Algoriphagus sp.]|uniref:hypothetical protein n=1 Tax=uncultured Algoriphagus sp. TaxID=417365 RepID=UPI00258DFB8B|nr:hypothetical protein [uncultured Algoriphagus sp.]